MARVGSTALYRLLVHLCLTGLNIWSLLAFARHRPTGMGKIDQHETHRGGGGWSGSYWGPSSFLFPPPAGWFVLPGPISCLIPQHISTGGCFPFVESILGNHHHVGRVFRSSLAFFGFSRKSHYLTILAFFMYHDISNLKPNPISSLKNQTNDFLTKHKTLLPFYGNAHGSFKVYTRWIFRCHYMQNWLCEDNYPDNYHDSFESQRFGS